METLRGGQSAFQSPLGRGDVRVHVDARAQAGARVYIHVYVCDKDGGISQSSLVLGLSPLETHPDLLIYPVTQLSVSFNSVEYGRVQEGAGAGWVVGENTYRSWRKGRGFTGMNCDYGVSPCIQTEG